MGSDAEQGVSGIPGRALLLLLAGIFALAIAAVAGVFAIDFWIGSDVLMTFNGHEVGGTADIAVAATIALVFGTTGIFCLMHYWTEWRMTR